MANSYDLSEGSLEKHVCQGKHPPPNENTFQVLATKLVEQEGAASSGNHVKRYRAIISDGKRYFDYAMFLIFTDMAHGSSSHEVPENHSIIKIINPSETSTSKDVRQNSIKYMKEKAIWIICRYDILRTGGEKIGTPLKIICKPPLIAEQYSTPEQSRRQNSQQNTPLKRRETSVEEESSASSAKRALFSTPSNIAHPTSSSLYKPSHTIKDLNPFQNKFRIKARVVKKSQIRSWANSRGEGQVFDVTLQDSSGDIKAAGFNDVAERLNAVFEENKVYMVEGAQIKPIQNRNFNTTHHNYELTFHGATKVQEVVEEASRDVPRTLYDFIKISELATKSEKEKVDVIGVILEVQDLQSVVTRAGRHTKKREIEIIDSSGCSIKLTLWGEKAERFPATTSGHKMFAVKGAEISEWQGKSLHCGFTSTFEIEPTCQEADTLREWFNGDSMNASSTQTLSNSGITLPSSANTELITLAEVKQNLSSNVEDIVKYFTVEASLINIKLDNAMYRACPNESCRRKVMEDPPNSDEYKCQKCDKMYPNFNWRFSLQGVIADFTDYHWITIFEESGQSIVGMSAGQLARKRDENLGEFERLLHNCRYVPYKFILKSKVETWNDEKRHKLSIVKATKVDRTDNQRTIRLNHDIENLKILLAL